MTLRLKYDKIHTKGRIDKPILWNPDKNEKLKKERGLSFEEIEAAILADELLDEVENKSGRHLGQKMFVLDFDGYIVLVPYVEEEEYIFLKTAFYSRKATRDFLRSKRI